VLRRIVETACLAEGDAVLEIGAGTGRLTRLLSERVGERGRVLAVELDVELLPVLNRLAEEEGNVIVVGGDFLKLDIPALLDEQGIVPPTCVVGNLPYSITTPILERLLSSTAWWSSATLMVQEEVARRLTTPPGEPGCGSISVFLHATAEVAYCFSVGEGAFSPPPKVRSAVVRLIPWRCPPVVVDDPEWLFRVSRAAFGRRRKTLLNALSTLPFSRDTILATIRAAEIDPRRRGETLSLEEFARMANAFAAKSRTNDVTR
jgi:16S rRNA (adenine1518-N6/adenine1519-N6)-dimethyltransferase